MFVTASQFYVFVSCVAFGSVFGILFGLSDCVKLFIKSKTLKVLSDVLAFIVVCFSYIVYAYVLKFPNLRAYMFLGVFAGILLTFKSFNILLAKTVKKIYNICVKKKRKIENDGKRF